MFQETSAKREIEMDDLVRAIDGHERWAILWDKMCETPEYRTMVKTSEIERCLAKKNHARTSTTTYPMLVGDFGGLDLAQYGTRTLTKESFRTPSAFDKALVHLFELLENAFVGLVELSNAHIAHADITVRNVMVHSNQCFYIDFGLAYRFQNTAYVRDHLKYLFTGTDRIYEAYPYEYCLYHGSHNTRQLHDELKDMKQGIYRDFHKEHLRFHELILGRSNIDKELATYMEAVHSGDYKPKLSKIIRKLDTYSVGILLPTLLHDVAEESGVDWEVLMTRCQTTSHPEILSLCKDMTEFRSEDRLTPTESLRRYREIQKGIETK
jgi:hypothetical protein